MLYHFSLLEYFGAKFGVYPTMILLFAPLLILTLPVILFFRKKISQKQYANWLGGCLAIIALWVILFFGFYWWIGLMAAVIAFIWGKLQSEVLINLSNYFNKCTGSDSKKLLIKTKR